MGVGGGVYPPHPSDTLPNGYPTPNILPFLWIPYLQIPYPQIPYPLDTLPPALDTLLPSGYPTIQKWHRTRDQEGTLTPEIPYPPAPHCEQIDRHLWTHYLPATTVTGANCNKTSTWNWGRFRRNILHITKCFRASEVLWCTCMTLLRCICKSLRLHWPKPGSAIATSFSVIAEPMNTQRCCHAVICLPYLIKINRIREGGSILEKTPILKKLTLVMWKGSAKTDHSA